MIRLNISFPVIPITQFWKADSFPYYHLKLANTSSVKRVLEGMIVSKTKKTQEKLPKKRNFVTKFSKNCLKWLKFTYFVDNTSKCIPYQKFLGTLQLFLTDSQKSRIHLVYLQNFSISR